MEPSTSHHHQPLGKRAEGAPSELCKKNSWAMRFRELLGRWTHLNAIRVTCSERAQEVLYSPLTLIPCPVLFFHLYNSNKLVNISIFLSSVSHFSKLPSLRRGLWEPPIYSLPVRSRGGRDLDCLSEVEAILGAESINLGDLTLIPGRQYQNWAIRQLWSIGKLVGVRETPQNMPA